MMEAKKNYKDEEKVLFEFSMGELIDAYVNYSKEDNSYYAHIMELDAISLKTHVMGIGGRVL